MSSWIMYRDSLKTRTVKNLGWLLRHWQQVESFTVEAITCPHERLTGDVKLRAIMRDRCEVSLYVSSFADRTVLWEWLHRPVFYGLRVVWLGSAPHVLSTDDRPATVAELVAVG